LPEPVAYRSFDGGQGDIAYETVGGHDGTVYGAEWLGAETLEVLAVNKLDDSIDCSPAITGKEMYLKGKKNRYCIAASE
jgi:hypothetical protein